MEGPRTHYWRAAHRRRGKDGEMVEVRGHWARRPAWMGRDKGDGTSACPVCGARVIVRAHNGGHLVTESGKGLRRIPHPCFTIGKGFAAARDPRTPDLFDAAEEGAAEDG